MMLFVQDSLNHNHKYVNLLQFVHLKLFLAGLLLNFISIIQTSNKIASINKQENVTNYHTPFNIEFFESNMRARNRFYREAPTNS